MRSELTESSNRERCRALPSSLHHDSFLFLRLSEPTGMQHREELEPGSHLIRISQQAVAVDELSSGGRVIAASQQDLRGTTEVMFL